MPASMGILANKKNIFNSKPSKFDIITNQQPLDDHEELSDKVYSLNNHNHDDSFPQIQSGAPMIKKGLPKNKFKSSVDMIKSLNEVDLVLEKLQNVDINDTIINSN